MDPMSLFWIAVCVFIVWWVVNDWDHEVTDEFVEGMKRAEKEHGKKQENEDK